MFHIENRRYIGNKFMLSSWIKECITANCEHLDSMFDVFAGTGAVTSALLDVFDTFYINDFLFSNEVIYKGFFLNQKYRQDILDNEKEFYASLDADDLPENYVSQYYGNKFFSRNDAKKIGYIRQHIQDQWLQKKISLKEYMILLSSLLYSLDRAANTVGHYDAYIKNKTIASRFQFDLIQPLKTEGKKIYIYREDSNVLSSKINASLAFIDPPYNSRQYSRFYHVLETITQWDFPKLYGVAMKPAESNMSDYCRNSAPKFFNDLVQKLNVQYIAVTYNNTYASKSTSSQNKITLEQILAILEKRGKTKVVDIPYRFFNSGKTDFSDHKEYLFFTEVIN